ncbi:hypothetical protein D3C76_1196020 [compost metagenome]
MQQTGDADINGRATFVIGIAFDAKRGQLRGVGIERREQAAGGLFQTAVRIRLQFANIARQIQRRLTAEQQLPLQRGRRESRDMLRRCRPAFAWIEHRAGIDRLRRERRTHADFPAFLLRCEGFARKFKAGHLRGNFTVAVAIQRTHRNKQRIAYARRQLNRLRLRAFKRH